MSPSVLYVGRHLAGQFRFLLAALGRVGQQVVGILGGHQPRAGQRQGDAAGVDGDPAPAPLLGDVGRRAAAAGRVEDEVAGVGGHEEAALDDLCVASEQRRLCPSNRAASVSSQMLLSGDDGKVVEDIGRIRAIVPMR